MGDEDHGRELPHRAPGAARGGSAQSAAPLLSEEVRQRLRVAVEAERARAANQEKRRSAESSQRLDTSRTENADVASSSVNGAGEPKRVPTPGISVWPERTAEPERVVKPRRGAKPERAATSERPAAPERTVKPESGRNVLVGPQVADGARPHADSPAKQQATELQAAGRKSPRRDRFLVAIALMVAIIVVAALVIGHVPVSPRKSGGPSLRRQEALAQSQAASWVASQVSKSAVVSCDQAMCAALSRDGFPAGKLLRLGPTSLPPVTSAVVVETPAVLYLFGSSLSQAWAPAVLATFGTGTAQVAVRVMAPHGTGTYVAELSNDLTARRNYGGTLLNNNQITLSSVARQQLSAGQVDSRLVLAIASMAHDQPVDITRFGNIGSGASPGVPLRFADMAVSEATADGMSIPDYEQALGVAVTAVNPQYQPTSSGTTTSSGKTVFRVEFTAPSPLGS
jgi:hypothetical protein